MKSISHKCAYLLHYSALNSERPDKGSIMSTRNNDKLESSSSESSELSGSSSESEELPTIKKKMSKDLNSSKTGVSGSKLPPTDKVPPKAPAENKQNNAAGGTKPSTTAGSQSSKTPQAQQQGGNPPPKKPITLAEFIRRGTVKPKFHSKEAHPDAELVFSIRLIETEAGNAMNRGDFLSHDAEKAVKSGLNIMMSYAQENTLKILREIAGLTAIKECFPNYFDLLVEILSAELPVPWRQFSTVYHSMPTAIQGMLRHGRPVLRTDMAPFAQANARTELDELFEYYDAVIVQMNEKAIFRKNEEENDKNRQASEEAAAANSGSVPSNTPTQNPEKAAEDNIPPVNAEIPEVKPSKQAANPEQLGQPKIPANHDKNQGENQKQKADPHENHQNGGLPFNLPNDFFGESDSSDEESPNAKKRKKKVKKSKKSEKNNAKRRKVDKNFKPGDLTDDEEAGVYKGSDSDDSNDEDSKSPVFKASGKGQREVLLATKVKVETSEGVQSRKPVEMYFNQIIMKLRFPPELSFDQACDVLVKKGKGTAERALKEILPLLPPAKRKRFFWPAMVIAASGHDMASLTQGDVDSTDIKRAFGADTKARVKICLRDIMNSRPEELHGRKASLFVIRCSKTKKAAEDIVDLATAGATSRFEWTAPEPLEEPAPFMLHIVSRLLAKQHSISIQHQKVADRELDDILEMADNCEVRERDMYMSEVEAIVRVINKSSFNYIEANPLNMIRLALGRVLRQKVKESSEQTLQIAKGVPAYCTPADPRAPAWQVGYPFPDHGFNWYGNWKKDGKKGKGKNENGHTAPEKGSQKGSGKRFDKIALLKRVSAFTATDANGTVVDLKSLLYCLWKDSKAGCSKNPCHFSHEKNGAFTCRGNASVDEIWDSFQRWAAIRGYKITPISNKGAKGGGKGASPNAAVITVPPAEVPQ